VTEGRFRLDLFHRLSVFQVHMPPLRDRREDIPMIAEQFLERFAAEQPGGQRQFSREAMDLLAKYDYPGNVRELENIVQRAVVLSRGTLITTADLPSHLSGLRAEPRDEGEAVTFVERVGAFERRLIVEALQAADGVQTRAARALGMSERHLRYKLKKYGLESAG
jgi:two-component system NtrC family response regulator